MKNLSYSPETTRVLGAKIVAYDTHIHFTDNDLLESDSIAFLNQDSSVVAGKILRVGVVEESSHFRLWFSYDFAAWEQSSIVFSKSYVISFGLFQEYLWVKDTINAKIKRYTFSSGSFTDEAVVCDSPNAMDMQLAPVSASSCYLAVVIPGTQNGYPGQYLIFARQELDGSSISWDSYHYIGLKGIEKFDAEQIGTKTYMILQGSFTTYEKNVCFVIEHDVTHNLLKSPKEIVPEDALSFIEETFIPDPTEDESTFKIKSCFSVKSISNINGLPVVSVEVKRPYGPSMFLMMTGPDPWKLGRDTFIYSDVTPWACCGDYPAAFYRKDQFKLHIIGLKIWCAGQNLRVSTDAVLPFCDKEDSPGYRTITGIVSANISDRSNDTSVLTVELRNGTVVEAGETLEFYQLINSVEYLMGTFEVDIPASEQRLNGTNTVATARGSAMKSLQGWESDTCYDLWSQTKTASRGDEVGKLVRVTGNWKELTDANGKAYGAELSSLNENGFMYSPEKSFRFGMVDLTFKYSEPKYSSFQGPGLCYYQKSRYEVSQELSTDEVKVKLEDVKESDIGYSGMFLLFGLHPTNGGSTGCWLARLTNSVWHHYTSTFHSFTMNDGDNIRAILFFHDGYFTACTYGEGGSETIFRSSYSADATGTTEALSALPWIKNGEGQACLVARNITPNSKAYSFDSTQLFIPVESVAGFPDQEIVLVDEEKISYKGKSKDVNIGPYDYAEGKLIDTWSSSGCGGETFAEYRSRNVVLQKISVSGSINGVKLSVKKFGTPRDLKVAIYRGPWTATKPIGYELSSSLVLASDIETSYTEVRANFPYPVTVDENCYIVLMLNVEAHHPVAGSGYIVETVNASSNPGLYGFDEDTDEKNILSCSYKMVAYTSYGSDGSYMVCASGVPNGDYSGMCLYTISGSASGFSFKIISNYYMGTDMVFEVDTMPYGLDSTTKLQIVPVLYVSSRAFDDTLATSHSEGTLVSVFSDPSFTIGKETRDKVFFSFSSDLNYTVEDMAVEIARKSGVQSFTLGKQYNGVVTIPIGGTDPVRKKNFSVRFSGSPSNPFGIYISGKNIETGSMESVAQYYIDPSNGLFCDGTANLLLGQGWHFSTSSYYEAVMSYYSGYITCWVNGLLIGWFKVPNESTSDLEYYAGLATTVDGTQVTVDWPEADIIVDNFIMDMGFRGAQLLQMMIKEKKIYYGDASDGSLRLYAVRKKINDIIGLRVQQGKTFTDSSIVTRLRVEGGVIQESIDVAAMRKYGNLFTSKNMEEVFDLADARRVSAELLEEFGSRVIFMTVVGASDPRIEPNDIIELSSGEEIIVDSITHTMGITNQDIQFDMILEGRCQRKDLPLE